MKSDQHPRMAGLLAAALVTTCTSHAQVVIAKWTFETTRPTSAGPFSPEVGLGSASGWHASSSTAYSNPSGNGSHESFASNKWAVGDYWQFQVSTLGQSGFLNLTWDQTSSKAGPRDYELRYSTDGSTFTTLGAYAVLENKRKPEGPGTWTASTVRPAYALNMDTSSVVGGLTGLANVYFRLVSISAMSAGGGTVGVSGNDRIDNFTVTAIPEPQTYAAAAGLGLVGFGCWRRFYR